MFISRGRDIKLKQAVKRCIVLSVLLPSMSVFAETTETSASHALQATQAKQSPITTRIATVKQFSSRSRSTFLKASEVDLSNTRKVTKDDFGRVLSTVRQPMNTRMIWLGQESRTHRPPKPKTTWLGGKGPSD